MVNLKQFAVAAAMSAGILGGSAAAQEKEQPEVAPVEKADTSRPQYIQGVALDNGCRQPANLEIALFCVAANRSYMEDRTVGAEVDTSDPSSEDVTQKSEAEASLDGPAQ